MNVPQQRPQPEGTRPDPFDAIMADLQHDLGVVLSRDGRGLPDRRVDPAATRPPAVAVAPAPVEKWGPSNPHVTTPLTLLMQAADNAHVLLDEIGGLAAAVTGEASGPRTRAPTKLPAALLPAMAALAHEIEATHAECIRQIVNLRGRL